jgi:hypothetical protein
MKTQEKNHGGRPKQYYTITAYGKKALANVRDHETNYETHSLKRYLSLANKKHDISPPAFPLRLLKWLCKPEYHLDIEGDLLELYHRRVVRGGRRRASIMLFKDVILLLRPGIIRTEYLSRKTMFQHNLIIIYRSLIDCFAWSTSITCN